MESRDVRFYLFISILVIVPSLSAQNKEAQCFDGDEVSTPSTMTYGNRRTTATRTTATRTKATRTTAARTTRQFIPRTTKYTYTSRPPAVDVSTIRSTSRSPPSFLTDKITTLLKNFAAFTASSRPPSEEDGNEYFANVLTLEMVTVASGNHFIVPPNEDKKLAKEQRKRAGGAVALWLELFCTEDVDAILNRVVRETVVQYRSTKVLMEVNTMRNILQTLLEKVNDTIEEDSFLASVYKSEQSMYLFRFFHAKAKPKVYVPLSHVTQGTVDAGMLEAWLNNVDIRKFFIHRQFLNMRKESGGENDQKNSVWVRTVLEVAREMCCIEKMQRIYDTALNEAAKNFDISQFPRRTLGLFIDKLNESIEADEVLKSAWTKRVNDALREETKCNFCQEKE